MTKNGKNKKQSWVLRYALPIVLIVLAGAFIYYGTKDGELAAVFSKATALCRECVGIG